VLFFLFFFFFQAEDGIRDFHVTGVQTCALPICTAGTLDATGSGPCQNTARQCTYSHGASDVPHLQPTRRSTRDRGRPTLRRTHRSEERRVGKEGRTQWTAEQ